MYIIALSPLFIPPSTPQLQFDSLFQLTKDGAKWARVTASNVSKPVSITEGEGATLPRLLLAPVTSAGSFAECMLLSCKERKGQFTQVRYDGKGLVP